MKNIKIYIIIVIATFLLYIAACTEYPNEATGVEDRVTDSSILVTMSSTENESQVPEEYAIETMQPVDYNENNKDEYFLSIEALGKVCINRSDVEYPTMDHLLYIYLVDRKGSGNPEHSLLIDIKYGKAYYTTNSIFLSAGYWGDVYTAVDLSETDIETITGLSSIQGILNWEDSYSAKHGDTYWLLTLYFDDGSYFRSGGQCYPEEYEKLEEDIWPLISEKSGEELWWMRGRP